MKDKDNYELTRILGLIFLNTGVGILIPKVNGFIESLLFGMVTVILNIVIVYLTEERNWK